MPLITQILTFAAGALLVGCATPPLAVNATHPASTSAPEAGTPPARSTLRPDANTMRTRELLAQRTRQADAAEAQPVEQVNPAPNAPMKGMNHDHQ